MEALVASLLILVSVSVTYAYLKAKDLGVALLQAKADLRDAAARLDHAAKNTHQLASQLEDLSKKVNAVSAKQGFLS
jgi:peptidoglycan hydrolase CwlO-like protein